MPAFAESASDPPLADSYYHLLRRAKNGRQVQVPALECELPMIDVWCLTTGSGTPEERVACTEAITTISASDPPLADSYYPLLRHAGGHGDDRIKNGCQVQVPVSKWELPMMDVACLTTGGGTPEERVACTEAITTISASDPPLADSYYPLLRHTGGHGDDRNKNGCQVQVPVSKWELPMMDVACLTTGGGTQEERVACTEPITTISASDPPLADSYYPLLRHTGGHGDDRNKNGCQVQVPVSKWELPMMDVTCLTTGGGTTEERVACTEPIAAAAAEWGSFQVPLTIIRILKTAGNKLLELITKRPTIVQDWHRIQCCRSIQLIILFSFPQATATKNFGAHGVSAFHMNDLEAAALIALAGVFFMTTLVLLYRIYRFVTLETSLRRKNIPFAMYPPKGTSYPAGDVHTVCAVCISEYKTYDRIAVLPACGHIFHRRCLREEVALESPRCPLCRAALA